MDLDHLIVDTPADGLVGQVAPKQRKAQLGAELRTLAGFATHDRPNDIHTTLLLFSILLLQFFLSFKYIIFGISTRIYIGNQVT